MAIHECPKCNKQFARVNHLETHLNRKKPCELDKSDFQCDRCHNSFGYQHNLTRHLKTCKGPKLNVQQQIANLQAEVKRLTDQSASASDANVQGVTVNQNITNNIQVTINNYGSEAQEHLESLSFAEMKHIFRLTPNHDTMLRMIKFIHMNDDHPENKTVRLDSKNSDVIKVFRNGRWRERPAQRTLYDLICRNRMRFVDLEASLIKGMAKAKFDDLRQYLEKVEDMANAEDSTLHCEHAFATLVDLVRQQLV